MMSDLDFSSMCAIFNFPSFLNTRYGFTNVSDIEDVRRAYPLLDMVDRDRRFDQVNVCTTSVPEMAFHYSFNLYSVL